MCPTFLQGAINDRPGYESRDPRRGEFAQCITNQPPPAHPLPSSHRHLERPSVSANPSTPRNTTVTGTLPTSSFPSPSFPSSLPSPPPSWPPPPPPPPRWVVVVDVALIHEAEDGRHVVYTCTWCLCSLSSFLRGEY